MAGPAYRHNATANCFIESSEGMNPVPSKHDLYRPVLQPQLIGSPANGNLSLPPSTFNTPSMLSSENGMAKAFLISLPLLCQSLCLMDHKI